MSQNHRKNYIRWVTDDRRTFFLSVFKNFFSSYYIAFTLGKVERMGIIIPFVKKEIGGLGW